MCYGASATFNNVPGLTSTQAKNGRTDQYMFAGGGRYEAGALHLDFDLSHLASVNKNRNIIVDIGKPLTAVDISIDTNGHGTTNMPGNPLADPSNFRFANGLFQDINRADSTLLAAQLDGAYDLGSFLRQLQFGFRSGCPWRQSRHAGQLGRAAGGFPGAVECCHSANRRWPALGHAQ